MAQSIQCDTSKMSIQTHLAAVMETLVHAAIAEMCKLVDKRSVFLINLELTEEQGSNEELWTQTQLESQVKMFASIMEDLGKEALRKIIKLVKEAKLLLDVENTSQGNMAPPSDCLSVSWKDKDYFHACGQSHSKVPKKLLDNQTDIPETPLQMTNSIKDELGQADQDKLATEKEYSDDGHGRSTEVGPGESFDEQTDNPESTNLTADSIMGESGQIDGDDKSVDVCPDESIDEQTARPECSLTIVMDEFGNVDVGELVAINWTPTDAPPAEKAGDLAGISGSTGPQKSTVKSKRKSNSLQRIPTREKSFICEICGKAFMQKCKLTLHMHVHTGKKPFKCEVCGKSFGQEKYLRTHRLIHTGEQPFVCWECGKRFNHAQNLVRHIHTVHTGLKAFSCHICQKRFTQAHTVKGHLLTHTGLKPFQCSVCDKSYRCPTSLKRHQAVHFDVEPSTCELYGKAFPNPSALHRHQCDQNKDSTDQTVKTAGQKAFTCMDCGKGFFQKVHLTIHRRTHTGEKPFSCTDCDKCFTTENNLRVHTRTHTGERPYSCDLCGKKFTQSSHMHTHKRYVHVTGKQFVCDKCGRMYVNPGNLKAHKCR